MGRVRFAGAALALVGALAAGCATSAQGLPPAGAGSPPPAASVPPSPSPPAVPLGHPAQADNGQVQATVFGYRAPLAAGSTWAGADVQVCVDKATIFDVSVSRAPWQLVTADGRTVDASLTGDGRFPQPAYPTDHRRLHPGDCVRGWIAFALPSGGQAASVQYAPTGAPPVRWTVR